MSKTTTDMNKPTTDEPKNGIWLEVADVCLDVGDQGNSYRVLLKGDREHPKPLWWPVAPVAKVPENFDLYHTILAEMDKKRTVLARLSCAMDSGNSLQCTAFRFQSAELGAR